MKKINLYKGRSEIKNWMDCRKWIKYGLDNDISISTFILFDGYGNNMDISQT